MKEYQARTLEGASGVELTIALYDGIIRFMHNAIEAADHNDVGQRRASVKRAMDIVMHLQATLNREIGGKPAEALSEFYVAMFALMLQGSQANSREKFEQVIIDVRRVRDAWKQVMLQPSLTTSASADEPANTLNEVASAAAWLAEGQMRTSLSVTA